jgi:ketosteroid isomerase-like protein
MRPRSTALLLALVGLGLTACGFVTLPVGPSDPLAAPPLRAQDAEFRTLMASWFDMWSPDAARGLQAQTLYADDGDALFIDPFAPLGGRLGESGHTAATRRAALAEFSAFSLEPHEDVRLRRTGDRAIAMVTFRALVTTKDGRSGDSDGRTTLVWERRHGAWKIVHEHTSLPLLEEWLGGPELHSDATELELIRPGDAEFERIVDEYLAAFVTSRTSDAAGADAPARFFYDAANVVVWDPTSRRPLLGWGAVAAHRDAADLRIYLTNKQRRGDVHAWRNGDMAWVTFAFSARATRRDGDRFEVVGRQTDVFQKRDGEWLIVHEHASIPLTPEGTPGTRSEVAAARTAPRTSRSVPTLAGIAQAPKIVADASADRATFAKLLADYCTAWTNANGAPDWDRIANFYAPDDNLKLADAQGLGQITERARMRPLFAELDRIALTANDDLHVFRRGDLVWTTNTQSFEWRGKAGHSAARAERQTAIWEQRGGRWVIVYEHLSTTP